MKDPKGQKKEPHQGNPSRLRCPRCNSRCEVTRKGDVRYRKCPTCGAQYLVKDIDS